MLTKELWNFIRDSGGLTTKNTLSTPFTGAENYVFKNISQCFNCIYLWSFPDLIMIDYLLRHIIMYRLPKKPIHLAVYHVT